MGCRVCFDQMPNEQNFMSCDQAQAHIEDVMSIDALSPTTRYIIEKLTIEKDCGPSGTVNAFKATYNQMTYPEAKEWIDCASKTDDQADFQKCVREKIKMMGIVSKYAWGPFKPHE